MWIIPLLGMALAFVQNLVPFALGTKEGALWHAPLSFVGVFAGEILALWATYFGTRRYVRRRRIVALVSSTLTILALGELSLPISTFRVVARRAQTSWLLSHIERGPVDVEALPSVPGRHRLRVVYTLTFPRAGQYGTFPAYIETSNGRTFGDYDLTANPEYYEDAFRFDAGKPYRFAVVFEVGDSSLDLAANPVNIDICGGNRTLLACRVIAFPWKR